MWKLSEEGFVMEYLVTKPDIKDYVSNLRAANQLEAEGKMRRDIVGVKKPRLEDMKVSLSFEDNIWQVYCAYGETMADLSDFYSTLKKIEINAATVIIVRESVRARVRLWSYMAVGVYCNGILAGEIDVPGYKPIKYRDFYLDLCKGENLIYLVCENLGARDSRNIFGLQFLDDFAVKDFKVTIPEVKLRDRVFEAKNFLDSLYIEGDNICFQGKAVSGACFMESKWEEDYEVYAAKKEKKYPITGYDRVKIPENMKSVCVEVGDERFCLSRTLEFAERIIPEYFKDNLWDIPGFNKRINVKNYFSYMKNIGEVGANNRVHFGFCMPNILARKELEKYNIPFNMLSPAITDRDRIFEMLNLVEERVDCADFELCGLFRFLKFHEDKSDKELLQRIEEVLLGFRYWMDMEGSDGMCFWSENHSLMFYYAAMEAGKRYPDKYFTSAKMKGDKLYALGRKRILEWIEDVEEYGFEEFQSSVYLCVTFGVMLNIIDFAEDMISKKMQKLCDNMLTQLAIQTFDSIEVSPMGRVYRNVLYPFMQGTQAILGLALGNAPISYGEGWIAFLHGSKYDLPETMEKYMNKPVSLSYSTGNALIFTKKTDDFCITSVASPRRDGKKRWENIRNKTENISSHSFTKSINESFHGTSFFEPGTYGYQQHMWSAALSNQAIFFVNHPGCAGEHSDMRPGYWFGNGVMPALKQYNDRNLLAAIYHIPDSHPIKFTHLYLPISRFEKFVFEDNWIFLKQKEGMAAIWCSEKLTAYNDMLFNCEYRACNTETAYLVICADLSEYGEFNNFIAEIRTLNPVFSYNVQGEKFEGNIYLNDEKILTWEEGADTTQEIK